MSTPKIEDLIHDWFQTEAEIAELMEFGLERDRVGPSGIKDELSKPSELPLISLRSSEISSVLKTFALRWFQENEAAADEPSPAHFDSLGNLHISLADLPYRGDVKLSVSAGEIPIFSRKLEVKDGPLELTVPLPDWGLRDLRLPASALTVSPR